MSKSLASALIKTKVSFKLMSRKIIGQKLIIITKDLLIVIKNSGFKVFLMQYWLIKQEKLFSLDIQWLDHI